MATRKIETTIALDGEQQFKQALASASREMRVMESEARALSAAYDQNGNAASFFTSRQQNLRNQIQQQEQIVSALEKAVRDSADTYGEASAKTDGWAIKLNNARARLSKLQKELESTDREAEELGRDSVKVGRQIENGIGDGAREAEDSVNSLFEAMQRDISSIKTSGAIQAVGTLWDMVSGAYSSVEGFVSGTVEYRRQLSFLKLNAEEGGFDWSKMKDNLIEITTLTGDASTSVEGLSNLMQTPGMTDDTIVRTIENLGGAVASFPDTLKFESLADGLQETLATGEATGQFAELLERMGVDMEAFNKALDESPTAVGDLEIALAYMAEGGLNDVYQKWQATNEEMNDAQATQAAIELELAEFAGTLEKYIVRPTKTAFLAALSYVNDTIELAETEGVGAAAEKVSTDLSDKIDATMGQAEKLTKKYDPMMIAGERIGKQLQGYFTDEKTTGTIAAEKSGQEAGENYSEGFATGLELNNPAQQAGFAIGNWLKDLFAEKDAESAAAEAAGTQAADAFLNGMELELDASLWGEGTEAEKLVTISPVEMEKAGEEAGEAMADGFEEGVSGMEGIAESVGAAIGAAFGAGLASKVSYVSAASGALAAAAAAGLRAAGQLGSLQRAGSTGVPMVINLDGRQVGTGIAPYASEFMASSLSYDVYID